MKRVKQNIKTYYLVEYEVGSYGDFYTIVLFVTDKKSVATKYVKKFNRILNHYTNYYKQFEDNQFGMPWLADEYVTQYFDRWNCLRKINRCYWKEVKFK